MLSDEELETKLTREREFFESHLDDIPRLNEVLTGFITFYDVVKSWENSYAEIYQVLENRSRSSPEVERVKTSILTNMKNLATTMEVLSGAEPGEMRYRESSFLTALGGINHTYLPSICQAKLDVREFHQKLRYAAFEIDERIGRCYAPLIFLNHPERFNTILEGLEPGVQDYLRRKTTESLDAHYGQVREFWGTLDDETMDDILSGEWSLLDEMRELQNTFEDVNPTFWSDVQMYLSDTVPRERVYFLVRMERCLDTLEGLAQSDVFSTPFLNDMKYLFQGGSMGQDLLTANLRKKIGAYVGATERIETLVCKAYAPLLLETAPKRFQEIFNSCHELEQDYLRQYVTRALENGILSMSAWELDRYF